MVLILAAFMDRVRLKAILLSGAAAPVVKAYPQQEMKGGGDHRVVLISRGLGVGQSLAFAAAVQR